MSTQFCSQNSPPTVPAARTSGPAEEDEQRNPAHDDAAALNGADAEADDAGTMLQAAEEEWTSRRLTELLQEMEARIEQFAKEDGGPVLMQRSVAVFDYTEKGVGGFGKVYVGAHVNAHNQVEQDDLAVKVVTMVENIDLEAAAMLANEICYLARISQAQHPNIAKLLGFSIDYKKHELRVHMPLAERALSLELQQLKRLKNRPPAPIRVVLIALGIVEGLMALHEQPTREGKGRILHLDLKPGNVLIGDEGATPMLADFGLSREVKPTIMKLSKGVGGTVIYQAPESRGEGPVELGEFSDVYSFGAILWEWLRGGEAPWLGVDPVPANTSLVATCGKAFPKLKPGETLPETATKPQKDLAQLAEDCLNLDKDSRPKLPQIKKRLESIRKEIQGEILPLSPSS